MKNFKKRLGSFKGFIEIKRYEFFEGVNWVLIRFIKLFWVFKEEINYKIKSDNCSVNYFLLLRFMMIRKERDEFYYVFNYFDYF